jgi:transglutaminase-like putative cysteine protease
VSWRLRIEHTTKVVYTGPVRTSFNEARMTPLTLPTQTTLESRVTVGSGVPVWTYSDYWGTYVSVFDLTEAHDDLVIRAISTVETEQFAGVPAADDRPGWSELRRHAREGRLLEFVLPTALTTVTQEISDAAIAEVSASGIGPDEAAAAISARVHDHVTYLPGATGVRTNAQEAWDKGQGVCQDMAQIAVSLLRPDPKARPGSTSVGQSHAWVEYWAGSWTALDPTSGAPVGERHVAVARGRDYADVPPLKGIYHGPPDSDMQVTVEVTRLA